MDGIVIGIEEFGDLLFSWRARDLLARSRRWTRPMPAGQITEQARLAPDGSPAAVSAPGAVERMIWFEQRFGGLRYTIRHDRENGMEYGLDGDCTVFRTEFGYAFTGILDGAWTWPVDILEDGRTLMRLAGDYPERVIDTSIVQRVESDALLAVAWRWPHHRYSFTVVSGTGPAVSTGAFPPAVPEATGPARRWWFDGDRAVLLRLRSWGTRGPDEIRPGPDCWTMWFFTRTETGLAWASGRHDDIGGAPDPEDDWCSMCLRLTPGSHSCIPAACP